MNTANNGNFIIPNDLQKNSDQAEQETPLQGLFMDLYGCLGGAANIEASGLECTPMPGFNKLLNMITDVMESKHINLSPHPIPNHYSSKSQPTMQSTVKNQNQKSSQSTNQIGESSSERQKVLHPNRPSHNPSKIPQLNIQRISGGRNKELPPMDTLNGIGDDTTNLNNNALEITNVLNDCREEISDMKRTMKKDFPDDFDQNIVDENNNIVNEAYCEQYLTKEANAKSMQRFESSLGIGSQMACRILESFVGVPVINSQHSVICNSASGQSNDRDNNSCTAASSVSSLSPTAKTSEYYDCYTGEDFSDSESTPLWPSTRCTTATGGASGSSDFTETEDTENGYGS